MGDSEWHFGRVLAGTPVVHTFTMVNREDGSLTVTSVKTSCGCNVVSDLPSEVPPQSSAEFTVHLNTSKKSGPVRELIHVGFKDGRWMSYALEGVVEPLRLAELDFGEVKRGEELTPLKFALVGDYDVKSVATDSEFLIVRQTSASAGRGKRSR